MGYNVTMIYTCTTNPSLDYYMKLDQAIRMGDINRSIDDGLLTGGKGVNVSIELNNLMVPSVAMGFLGGFVRDHYLDKLSAYHLIQARFVPIEGCTRINLKISTEIETIINAKGPSISATEFEKLVKRLDRVDNGDIFILSGNVQAEISAAMKGVLIDLAGRGVKLILDTNAELVRDSLDHGPYIVKCNLEELEALAQSIITDESSIIAAASSLVEKGAKIVLASVGKDGAYLISKDAIYCHRGLEGTVVSTTGCGDAMVAGFVFNLQRGANELEAFAYACAAGTATAFARGMATREEIDKIYDLIEIERLS